MVLKKAMNEYYCPLPLTTLYCHIALFDCLVILFRSQNIVIYNYHTHELCDCK